MMSVSASAHDACTPATRSQSDPPPPQVAPSSSSSHTERLPEHQLRLLSRSVHPSPFRHEAAPVRLPTGGSATDSASGSAATTAAQRMDEWMDATQLMTMNVPLGEPLYSAVGDAEALQGLLPGPGPLARDSLALPTRQSDSSLPARGSGEHALWTNCGHLGAETHL